MKKSPIRYFISIFLLLVFAAGIILPGSLNHKSKANFSVGKEKAENENMEKESSIETPYKELFSEFYFMFGNSDHISPDKLNYSDQNVSFIQSCFLPVLTPPPDKF